MLIWKISASRASLVAQWLRICLPMQGTQVWSLVQEDATCRGATKPVRHNYWACALEPASHNYWACMLQLLKPVLHNKRSHHCKTLLTATKSRPSSVQLQKARVQQWRPNRAKNKYIKIKEDWKPPNSKKKKKKRKEKKKEMVVVHVVKIPNLAHNICIW